MNDYSTSQNMITIIMLIASYYTIFAIGVREKKNIKIVSILFLWHTIFSITFVFLTSNGGSSDAATYYINSIRGTNIEFFPGSRFITFITYPISKLLDFSYLNTTLFFNIIGTFGLVLLYLALKDYLIKLKWYWYLILLMPSISYWSSGIGKDAISFFSVCLLIYATKNKKSKQILYLISIFLMFMVRPHIAFVILISFVAYFVIQSKSNILIKLSVLPIIGGIVFSSLGFVQEYTGIEDVSVSGVDDYYESREDLNMGGGSSINTSSMSLPVKIFSYIFRPFPFEAHNLISLIASVENTYLLFFFSYLIFKTKGSLKSFFMNENLWLSLYVIITCVMLSFGLKNLGIAARQKWMFVPVLIYLFIQSYSNSRLVRKKTNNEILNNS
ncbi:hypothetical protein [Psychrobacter sp. AOP3-A1-26]|uniref:hypothetical protein n=1 Tax=Psychrobacter sp. AOP3-A1-26 TaxID=3457700 RepID=UPI004036EE64